MCMYEHTHTHTFTHTHTHTHTHNNHSQIITYIYLLKYKFAHKIFIPSHQQLVHLYKDCTTLEKINK